MQTLKKMFINVLSKNISQYYLKQGTLIKCFTVKKDSHKSIKAILLLLINIHG